MGGMVGVPEMIPHIHWHRHIFTTAVWAYYECRCGHRQALRWSPRGHEPLDEQWLAGMDAVPKFTQGQP